ncbi:MAG: nucleoside phosphorylase [Caldisericia bacterium]|nr:nucleoside phosphorylase [Caldisericia bacterium]
MNHIALTTESIQNATFACITGDPYRIEELANQKQFDAKIIERKREFTIAIAYVQNKPLLFASHGIGGSSLEILVEELSQIGIRDILRVGTSGAIQPFVKQGEVVITQASIRLDGVSPFYAPIEYPAIAHYEWVSLLLESAKKKNIPHHVGITASTASFYPGQNRFDTTKKYIIPRWNDAMEQWKQLGVLNYEMESASLFVIASTLGIRAGCITSIVSDRTLKEDLFSTEVDPVTLSWEVAWDGIQCWLESK